MPEAAVAEDTATQGKSALVSPMRRAPTASAEEKSPGAEEPYIGVAIRLKPEQLLRRFHNLEE